MGMSDEYFLWKVTFSYDEPADFAPRLAKQTYTLIAKGKKEAESKAFSDFKKTSIY